MSDAAQEKSSDNMKAWIATQDLAELNKSWFTQVLGIASVLNIGARVYEILGDNDNAKKLAEEGINNQKKKSVILIVI